MAKECAILPGANPTPAALAPILLRPIPRRRRPRRAPKCQNGEIRMSSDRFTIDRRKLGLLGAGLALPASRLDFVPSLIPQAHAQAAATGTEPIKVGILHS